jgi:hypothetical protein
MLRRGDNRPLDEIAINKSRLAEAAVVLDFAPDLTEKIFAGGMGDVAETFDRELAEIARAAGAPVTKVPKGVSGLEVSIDEVDPKVL